MMTRRASNYPYRWGICWGGGGARGVGTRTDAVDRPSSLILICKTFETEEALFCQLETGDISLRSNSGSWPLVRYWLRGSIACPAQSCF